MIVEMIGPPGAGKTTLLPTLLATLREQGFVAHTVTEAARPLTQRTVAGRILQQISPAPLRDPLLWRLFLLLSFLYRARFVARRPRLIWNVLRWQRGRPRAALARQRKVLFWFMRLTGYYEFLRTRLQPDEVLVLDEGFLHRVVQLFSSHVERPNAGHIHRYTKLIPEPDLVVSVFAPPALCLQRVTARGLWQPFQNRDEADVERFVHNAHQATMIALKFSRTQGWPLLEIDNSEETPAPAQQALKQALHAVAAPQRFDVQAGLA